MIRMCKGILILVSVLLVLILSALTTGRAGAATVAVDSTELASLRQLIERQNQKIDALNEKVLQLEARETSRDTGLAAPRLPAIVIDTNGVPLESLAAAGADGATPRPIAQVSAGANGFLFKSADTNFGLALHGLVQTDTRTFFNDNSLSQNNTGFLLRRARPIFEGQFFKDFDFRVAPDFGLPAIQLYDAYLDWHCSSALQFRVGKLKGPVGLENQQTDAAALFNEKSLATDLVPYRNLGVQASGEEFDESLSWAAGVYNGVGDGSLAANSMVNNDFEVGGRLFWLPFKHSAAIPLQGLGLGMGASYSEISSNSAMMPSTLGGTLPGYLTAGQQQFFAYNPIYGSVVSDGPHWRICPQGYYYFGPFGLQGEYVISDQSVMNNATLGRAALDNRAWQISAQWVLTGEPASFTGLTPEHSFNLQRRQWGAWQLVARYSALDLDANAFNGFADPTTSARSAESWSVGINWWLNQNVRVLTSFSHTVFQGGGGVNVFVPSTTVAPATATAQDENTLFTRIQIAF